MRLGFVVDGRSEFSSLPIVLDKVRGSAPVTLLNPLLADIQPYAPIGHAIRVCRPALVQLAARRVDEIVVLVYREERAECPGELAEDLRIGLQRCTSVSVAVVIKDRKFENWLVADPDALAAQHARCVLSQADRARIEPNKADSADAEAILRRTVRGEYDKVADSKRILSEADLLRMAANSRSFRRMIRVMKISPYRHQSRRPV